MAIGGTRVVQITNIAPQATKDQMQTLFGYLGKIEDIRLYPTIRDVSCPVQSRICYVKFVDPSTVGIAQHMTNTVFIDRALIVIPVQNGEIPDEYYALEMTRNGTIVPGLCPTEPQMPSNVINSPHVYQGQQVIVTYDPKLEANSLPPYPPVPVSYDSRRIEETRRTVLVQNLDSSISSEDIINFFSPIGEVKYMRYCTKSSDNSTCMLVELSEQPQVVEALKMSDKELKGRPLKIVHATQPITKPQAKSNEAAQKEIEEAMTRVKEAQNLISATIDPVIGILSKDKRSSRRSRSRSRGRYRRSRTRSRSRRRSRSHRRSRSRSRDRRRRSKSRSKRTRSRSRRRSRSRKRSRSRRSRSSPRSRSRKSRSKSRSGRKRRSKEKTRKSRDQSRERDKTGTPKERERERSSRDKEGAKAKEKRNDKENSTDVEEKRSVKRRSRSRSKKSRSRSKKSRSRDRKRSRSREIRRSRSRGRKKSPTSRTSKKRSRSRSRERDHKRDKKDKTKSKRDRSRSRSKFTRNYDEEEKGYDEKSRKRSPEETQESSDNPTEKESSEKSDNMDISNSP